MGLAIVETVKRALPANSKTVLVVEDEAFIRLDISDYLRAHGYTVIEATSAADAIRVLEGNSEVAAVFTDVRLPGSVDGLELAHYVQGHHAHIPVIITSGHVLSQEIAGSLDVAFVAKPYNRAQVLHAIERQLRHREENN